MRERYSARLAGLRDQRRVCGEEESVAADHQFEARGVALEARRPTHKACGIIRRCRQPLGWRFHVPKGYNPFGGGIYAA